MGIDVVLLALGSVDGSVWILVGKEVTVEEVVDLVPSEVPFPGVGSRVGMEIGSEIVLEPVVIGELVMVELTSEIIPVGRTMPDVEETKEEIKEVGFRGRVPFVSTGSGVSVVRVAMLDKMLLRIGTLVISVGTVLLTGIARVPVGTRVENVREEMISVNDGNNDCKVEETPEAPMIGVVSIQISKRIETIGAARFVWYHLRY